MTIKLLPHTGIISCKVFKPELSALGVEESKIVYLEQNFHRDPAALLEKVKASLAVLERNKDLEMIILFYGYCGGGLANLSSDRLKLVIPLAHDCIPLIMGACLGNACSSNTDHGGSHAFYLSPGWIDYGLTPYTEYFASIETYGREDALWIGMEMLKGYKELVLVETVADLKPHHRKYARNMASLFGLTMREVKADKSWLVNLLLGHSSEYISVINPGDCISQGLYPLAEYSAPRA